MATWTNWSGTVTAQVEVATPTSVGELQEIVSKAAADGRHVKAIGAGHSFTAIGQTDGVQIRPDGLSGVLRADRETGRVTVLAGTRLHELNDALWPLGLALANLGDIDVQTIAGAISTGTHGTGAKLGGLATQVCGMQLVQADGALLDVDPTCCPPRRRPRRARRDRHGDAAVRAGVRARRQRGAGCAGRGARRPRPQHRRQRPLRVLLVPAHPPGAHQAQQPGAAATPRSARSAGCGTTSTTSSSRTPSSTGSTGSPPAVPALIPRANAIAARALSARDYIDRSYRVFASPRRVVFREMEYAVPRDAVPHVLAEIEAWLRAQRRADRLPGRGPVRGRRRHVALDRVRPSVRLRRRAPVPPARPRAVLPGRRGHRQVGGRPPALGQAALPRRRIAGARRTPGSATSWPCATSSTRSASSATTTSPASSAAPDGVCSRRSGAPRISSAHASAALRRARR